MHFAPDVEFCGWLDATLRKEQNIIMNNLQAEIMRQLDQHRQEVIKVVKSKMSRSSRAHECIAKEPISGSGILLEDLEVKDEGNKLHIPDTNIDSTTPPQRKDAVENTRHAEAQLQSQSADIPQLAPKRTEDLSNISIKSQLKRERAQESAEKRRYSTKALNDLAGQPDVLPPTSSMLRKLVASNAFEITSAGLILANVLVLCAGLQYQGLQAGYELNLGGFSQPAADAWPGAKKTLDTSNLVFNILFTIELVMRLVVRRLASFKSGWIWFDTCLLSINWVDFAGFIAIGLDPMLLRLLRLIRILRLLKVLKTSKAVDTLFLFVKSIQSSFTILLWSFSLLFILQFAVGLAMCQTLSGFIHDESKPLAMRQAVFEYFGTPPRAVLTMFEIALANWVTTCRLLVEQVSGWFGAFYIFYRGCLLFSVMRVVTSVFIAETNRIAASDDELAITKKQRAKELYGSKLKEVFLELDLSNDGYLTMDEFNSMMSDDLIKVWLTTLEIDTLDLNQLFQMLADDDARFNLNEFVSCLSRVRGPAKSVDMLKAITLVGKLEKKVDMLLNGKLLNDKQLVVIENQHGVNCQSSRTASRMLSANGHHHQHESLS